MLDDHNPALSSSSIRKSLTFSGGVSFYFLGFAFCFFRFTSSSFLFSSFSSMPTRLLLNSHQHPLLCFFPFPFLVGSFSFFFFSLSSWLFGKTFSFLFFLYLLSGEVLSSFSSAPTRLFLNREKNPFFYLSSRYFSMPLYLLFD